MNIASVTCEKCPARRDCIDEPQTMPDKAKTVRTLTCSPQTRVVNLHGQLDGKDESSSQTPNEQLSIIKQEVLHTYHCPTSERRLFIDPLDQRINPRMSPHFNLNSGATSSTRTPIQDYTYGPLNRLNQRD